MKRTATDPAMVRWLEQMVPSALLCQQCGECASVCPSQRHSGIRPADLMARAALGAVDPAKEPGLWQCARCMACSERCPSDAGPGETIALLRELATQGGNRPPYFIEEAKRFLQTGICFPRTGMTKKLRKDLGLPDGEITAAALKDVAAISERTGLGRLKLE